MARRPAKKRTFHQELVLNRWMLSHFLGDGLMTLKARLGDDRHEGIDDDGQTKFFHELTRNLFNMDRVTEAEARRPLPPGRHPMQLPESSRLFGVTSSRDRSRRLGAG